MFSLVGSRRKSRVYNSAVALFALTLALPALSTSRVGAAVELAHPTSASVAAGGPSPYFVVSSLTSDNGLPQNSVKDIAQTPDGYVWAATQEGLARFDGVRFTIFNTRTSPGLVSNNIHQLIVDGAGSLWVLANSGVSRYRNGVFEDVTPKQRGGTDRMLYLWLGGDGRVYASSDTSMWRGGPAGFESLTRLSRCFPEKSFFFACGRDGTVWLLGQVGHRLVSIRNGVVRGYDESRNAPYSGLAVDPSDRPWLAATRLWSMAADGRLVAASGIVPDAKQTLNWLYCDNHGVFWFWVGRSLCTYRNGDKAVRVLATSTADTAWSRLDGHGGLWSLFRGKPDMIWDVSPDGDVAAWQTPSRRVTIERFTTTAPVAVEWQFPVLRTADGVGFVGTYGGLNAVSPGRCDTLYTNEGLPEGEIQAVYQTRDGTLWVAGLGKKFGTLQDGRFVPAADPNLRNADVSSMAQDASGDLWVSTASNHLWRVHKGHATDARSLIQGVDKLVPVSTLAVDGSDVWLGMGKCLVALRHGKSAAYPTAGSSPLMNVTFAVTVARDGRVFVGGQQGFAFLDPKTGKFTYFGAESGLPSVPVISILEDTQGDVWLGLWGGGLARFKGGKVTCLSTRDGLYADSIQSMVEGGGKLWMGSSKGIFSVDRDQLAAYTDAIASGHPQSRPIICTPLTAADGMRGGQSAAARQPLAVQAMDGSLWFACVRGIAHVSAAQPAFHRDASLPMTIEGAAIDKRSIALDGKASARPGPGSLTVDYTALSYASPADTRFYYRLDGIDSTWTDAGTRRSAYYTNLPPGHYRFHVIACDAFGNWNRTGARFDFTIQPHYYQTLWFRVLVVVLCIAAGIALGIVRVRQLQRVNRMLEAKVDERTKLLEAANQQLWDSREEVVAQNEELQAMQSELESRNEELADANERLEDLATVDALTGLKNRRALAERIVDSFRIAERYQKDLSVVILDVDHFKAYNDAFGHPAGDLVLKQVAAILMSVARDTDLVVRYGGEEFLILMPLTGPDGAVQLADRMRVAIEQAHWPVRDVTASFGVGCIDPSILTPDDLVAAADTALYASKKAGKNRVTLYGETAASRAA